MAISSGNQSKKLRVNSVLKWISSNSVCREFLPVVGSWFSIARNPRFYKGSLENGCNNKLISRITPSMRKDAQAALLDYLHVNRGFEYTVAENMSRNSPQFLGELIRKANPEGDTALAVTRFVCYHPINEFEPFFESLGLKASEYSPLLPRKLMYLTDDELLLENYRVLCSYGIKRCMIGRIYREATEVFRYGSGVLSKKLMAYEQLGLSSGSVARTVACFPNLLIGDVDVDLVNVLEMLKSMGIEFGWIEEQLSQRNSCNWRQSFLLLKSLSNIACMERDKLREIVADHPEIMFEGEHSLLLIGFLLKMGSSIDEIVSSILQNFPKKMQVAKFLSNLRQCVHMLDEIHLEPYEIRDIVHSHSLLMGSYTMKKTKTLLYRLNVGKKLLREIVRENPEEMKNWVIGVGVTPLQSPGGKQKSKSSKTKFLSGLGYEENSVEMARAVKVFRGKGFELLERFDCLVNAGLSKEDVVKMVTTSPHVLNQSKDVTQEKIKFLVNEMGYDLTCLVRFPSVLNFRVERVKLRLLMYDWLKGEGVVRLNLSLSNLIASSDSVFYSRYVELHSGGPHVWQDLKKKIYGE
uniref:Cgi-12 protein-related-mitochondrial transcription termination factor, mterf n=1 Tax=Linum usitatissimum TaxID=4006 RepID=A0A165G0W1_LINUS|nr:cgi-12 protein-related-mitochondrial transcription termination factor, mterf [Linum usitatissimum]